MKNRLFLFILLVGCFNASAENGYDLWLRYQRITDPVLIKEYKTTFQALEANRTSSTISVAIKELKTGIKNMLGYDIPSDNNSGNKQNKIVIGLFGTPGVSSLLSVKDPKFFGPEGFLIQTVMKESHIYTIITANEDIGLLYGVFRLLSLMQQGYSVRQISIKDVPKIRLRTLNHWDNLDGTIERGYAGYSIWNWQRLPGVTEKRYVDYARANASVGINSVVLNNVNASVRSLRNDYIRKTAALAEVFRPYGIKVFLTAKFSAPKELGKLKTADPKDPEVIKWWADKANEIYKYIPDFGGFLVKANSEGQPGPGDYGRTHAEGANMLAAALKPHGGVVMWRTFVYENRKNIDRANQAYDEFKPLDGQFADNVLLQTKYGPIDFQPREAFSPLFGAMPKTNLTMELQITQEYFGYATHLVYLGPLFQEYLQMDTYGKGKGTTIADVIDGKTYGNKVTGIAGVANIGTDINWCGHPFAQANWYAFGRFAWNPDANADKIADEWLRMTFTHNEGFIKPVKKMMMRSREAAVNYMTPLGLSHIMNLGTHYGPEPWGKIPGWNSWDYHQADSIGLGVPRAATGSNASAQYADFWKEKFNNPKTTPENLLLWFHHVPWNYKMQSGRTMWDELVSKYYEGVQEIAGMQELWQLQKGKIDQERYDYVNALLKQQYREAKWWRDACVLYFQQYSYRPIPDKFERPEHDLNYYKTIPYPED